MAKNSNMIAAKKAKNDEFYTQMSDICAELTHQEYKDFFKGKHVFLNCDDPKESNFWKFFSLNFQNFGLKRLTSTHYDSTKPTYRLDLLGDQNGDGIIDDRDIIMTPLQGNGDFRNPECIDILKECDVVVTNPPFSLFREYIEQLMKYDKKFVIIANMNSITYKETFRYIKNEQMWPGYGFNKTMEFRLPDSYTKFNRQDSQGTKYGKVPAIIWWTNIDLKKRHQPLLLVKDFNIQDYPKYDNYCAFNVNKVSEIPKDDFIEIEIPDSEYQMWKNIYGDDLQIISRGGGKTVIKIKNPIYGVPITYLGNHCSNQFKIIGHEHDILGDGGSIHINQFEINNIGIYKRLLIQKL